MDVLHRAVLRWRLRRTPHQELALQHELLVRLARRCAYDFRHASDFIPPDHWTAEMRWGDRAQHWIGLFGAGNPGKDYRHRLQVDLMMLEGRLETYRRLLTEHGITDPYEAERLPF